MTRPKQALVHATAIVEDGVEIGTGTAVWDSAHLRAGAHVGAECIIGEKTYLGPGVSVGSRVKINAFVYVCAGVTIEDGVMLGAGTTFTNDRYPRATTPDLHALLPSELDGDAALTLVCEGATIGARVVIGSGLRVGRFAMVGMGAVVTRPVPDFHLALGQPARSVGSVCRCGRRTASFAEGDRPVIEAACPACGRWYGFAGTAVSELPLRSSPADP